ncbi:MAG: thioredoxin family protein [Acidobacteriota bacterium]
MDRSEESPAPASSPRPESQSRLSPILLWVLIAAALFRVVTAVMDREGKESGAGLVRWQPHEKAAALSQATKKPILYQFTAAWCGPCHLLDKNWSDASIAQSVNGEFVPSRVIDRQREDGENPPDIGDLQRRYDITAFPTLVAVAPDGRLLGKLEGYGGRDVLLRFLKEPGAK